MGLISRILIPRRVRRVAHPVRSVKRAATPRSIKKLQHGLHPVRNAAYGVERSLNTKTPKGRRQSQVWHHPGCNINHRSKETADRCKVRKVNQR